MATLTHPTRPPIFTYSDDSCIRSHKKCALFQRGEHSTPLSCDEEMRAHTKDSFSHHVALLICIFHFSLFFHPWWLGINTMTRLLKKIEWNAQPDEMTKVWVVFVLHWQWRVCVCRALMSVHALSLLLHLRMMLEWKSNSYESTEGREMSKWKMLYGSLVTNLLFCGGRTGVQEWSWRKLEVNFVVFSSAPLHFTRHSTHKEGKCCLLLSLSKDLRWDVSGSILIKKKWKKKVTHNLWLPNWIVSLHFISRRIKQFFSLSAPATSLLRQQPKV